MAEDPPDGPPRGARLSRIPFGPLRETARGPGHMPTLSAAGRERMTHVPAR
jgi:hypothetical protein